MRGAGRLRIQPPLAETCDLALVATRNQVAGGFAARNPSPKSAARGVEAQGSLLSDPYWNAFPDIDSRSLVLGSAVFKKSLSG
jgi:hypothetical protein